MALSSLPRIAYRRSTSSDVLDDLFLQHYARLVARAEHLVGRGRQTAEDLVHDMYVRLALRRFDADSVRNIEAYLFMTLRNVHLSHVRRHQSKIATTVSIVDHESAVAGLCSLATEEERQHAFDALRQVVHYACFRKSTSTAASALILRFFHGYYPREIARVAQTTEAVAIERLRLARADVRSYLADPTRLRRFDERRSWRSGIGGSDEAALTLALRRTIFQACTDACPTDRALDYLYARSEPLGVATLAHLVSCPGCLDAVNRRLGLPSLDARDPSDRLGRGGPRTGGTGKAGGSDLSEALHTRLEDARRDYPQEMQIAVNGLFLSTQALSGRLNEHLKLLLPEPVGFVEIFSEHERCLLYLDVEPPPTGAVEQSTNVRLSDGRLLSATVTFGDAVPMLQVVYDDRSAGVDPEGTVERRRESTTDGLPIAQWTLWPVALRFVLAGLVLGVLLANPRQTLAAVDHMRRAIVESLVSLVERLRPRPRLSSRPVASLTGVPPAARAVDRVAPTLSEPSASGERDTEVELAETMVEALGILDTAGALLQEQLDVTRRSDARLSIDGVVASEARRRELIAALGNLPTRRLRVDIVSVEQALRPARAQTMATNAPMRSAELTHDRQPAGFESIRQYLAAPAASAGAAPESTADPRIAEAVRQFATSLVSRSLQARLHGRTVRQLVAGVPPAAAERMSPAARARWHELVRRHAEMLHRETGSLRRDLERLFAAAPDERAVGAPQTGGDLWQMAERLFALSSSHDLAVRDAFTVATNGHESMDVATPAFRDSLLEAERLANVLTAATSSPASP